MKFPVKGHPVTGVVVPVSALRSRQSLGIGEFADLVPFGRWALSVGFELVQILPVNDTGFANSPYSSRSAFALHPVYARLADFPEACSESGKSAVRSVTEQCRQEGLNGDQIDYAAVLKCKLRTLRLLWNEASAQTLKEVEGWSKKNTWVRAYALFSFLQEHNHSHPWWEWSEYRDPSGRDCKRLWKTHGQSARFWIWLQMRLEEQLHTVCHELDHMGVALKGDIPILITDDSADLWAERNNFSLSFRAGAPPDALAADGQNWGFPTYDWDHLRRTGNRWWKKRLAQAAKFYHAYRIDHVLGFFRIWAVPEGDVTAINGHYNPAVPISRARLEEAGFDSGRITWLTCAHFSGDRLRHDYGEEAESVQKMLERVGDEDLWKAPEIPPTETAVAASGLSGAAAERFTEDLRNRVLIGVGPDSFHPYLNFRDTEVWQGLSDQERAAIEDLVFRFFVESEKLWAARAHKLLGMMKMDGNMLVCAEDLGVVPDCVPEVLRDLNILSLKIFRWVRDWDEPSQPYVPVESYPELSVTTASVHDTSTLRGWLAEENAGDEALHAVLGIDTQADLQGPNGVRLVLEKLQDSPSLIVAHPLQDFLALEPSCVEENPDRERINTPGTVGISNWSWRMKPFIEDLPGNATLKQSIETLCARRSGRKVAFPGG